MVLSEAIDETRADSGHLRVAVGAGIPETRCRIAATLEADDPSLSLLEIHDPSDFVEMGIDAATIIVLVCDVDRPSEMAALRRLRREVRGPAIVAVCPEATGTGVRRALDAGVDALVVEAELESTLAVAVRAVSSGQSVVPRKVRASVERPTFSHRERQVLSYVSRGLTNAQIAKQLFLSESTIKSHLSSTFAKFGVRSRREAAALFLELEPGASVGETLAAPSAPA
jgi:DNA-binding NarL/FixJ family response regulator